MAWSFGDGFDLYAASTDAINGYWDSGTCGFNLVAGRFAGSRATNWNGSNSVWLVKSSGQNDAVHHISVAITQTASFGSTAAQFFQLLDGTTVQVCIVFNSSGAIQLTSSTPTGTVLATYANAITATNTWYAFEFEVIISNTVGRFRVRKNGNTSDDFDSGATLNTRVSANNYANKLQIGYNANAGTQQLDDLFWRSDASSVAWMGDIRCFTRMPVSDASVQFARVPTNAIAAQTTAQASTVSKGADNGIMSAFIASYSGTIASGTVAITTGGTGSMKAAIYDATRTIVLATANVVVNPVSGLNAITFAAPLTVTKGTTYHLAVDQNVALVYTCTSVNQYSFSVPYASFPAASPSLTSGQQGPVIALTIVSTVNADMVNEAQQDAATSYVYDSTAGHADLYGIGVIGSTPANVIAVTTRGYMQKSDAGSRTASVQLKSGATTVATPTLTLTSSGWTWAWRTDTTDPNTSAAWTAVAVNNAQIGPLVVT